MKVIRRDELDELKESRAADLVRIANETVGDVFDAKVSGSNNNVRLVEKGDNKYPMQIWVMSAPHHRVISVESEKYKDHAVSLAEKYKAEELGEFVVEGHY